MKLRATAPRKRDETHVLAKRRICWSMKKSGVLKAVAAKGGG
jgi:hypothetical protein